jgi:hypothetical protein
VPPEIAEKARITTLRSGPVKTGFKPAFMASSFQQSGSPLSPMTQHQPLRRMSAFARGLAALLTMFFLLTGGTSARCLLPAPSQILFQQGDPHAEGAKLLQVWELRDRAKWASPADPADPAYADFLKQVRQRAGKTDPAFLLSQAAHPNNKIVLKNRLAWVHPATCLEKSLQAIQHRRIGTFQSPTEFASIVLQSGGLLRIYYYTVNADGIGRADPITGPALRDVKAGWKTLFILHNHNFHPGKPAINGPLAPSGPDADFALNSRDDLKMLEARITNGVHTVRIPASAFGEFQTKD